jgi:gp32 DNA binding protein like
MRITFSIANYRKIIRKLRIGEKFMSNSRLAALKALFKKEKEQKADNGGGKRHGDFYPFWQMDVNKKAIVRILPDKNEDNPYMFYVDKLEHTLSIDGKDERVPCLQMYGEKCPACDLSRAFYKQEGKGSANGKYYYRKKTSLVRVLVVEDPLPADEDTGETAAGKAMNTQFGYQLMEKIKEEISSDELGEDDPWDMQKGYNFNIKKTPQGEFGTYSVGSGFARHSTAIDPDIADTLELIDLQTLLPANPGYEAVKRKLDAHLNGDSATGDDADGGDDGDDDAPPEAKTEVKAPAKAPATKAPAKVEPEVDSDDDAEDVLAQIRQNRRRTV